MSHIYLLFTLLRNVNTPGVEVKYNTSYPYSLKFFRSIDKFFILVYNLPTIMYSRVNFRVNHKKYINAFLMGFYYLWKHIKFWVLPLVILSVFAYFSLVVRSVTLFKVVLEWFLVLNVFYWLISGFVFFIKKYKYNRFTAAIQRFWRRSFILFWLIESSLFIVFIYLLFNASQEPAFAFDFIQLNKSRLYSWKFFIYKSFYVFLVIIVTYLLMLSAKWNSFSKISKYLFVITGLLTYIVWLEFYQFFYVINWYGEIVWIFDTDDKVWYAESIFKRSRILNHYVTICVIAKFWHIIYIYIFWIFFLLRALEQNKISYIILSANLQNFLILYIMNWLLMYPWFKFIFRKFLTYNHRSFKEFHEFVVSGFYNDFCLLLKSVFTINPVFKFFERKKFYYSANTITGPQSFIKEFMKPQFVELFLFINIFVFYAVLSCIYF